MFDHEPGSKDWWAETGLIALGGVALALWLWDGPLPTPAGTPEATDFPYLAHEPRTLGDMFDGGCITADHLRAMRDGRDLTITTCGDQPMAPWPRQFQ